MRGLNVLAASICTPLAAPVIAATRLRGGNAASARGAASMITEAVSHRPRRRVRRHAGGADGLGVLRRPGRARPPARQGRISPSPCGWTPRSAPRSPPSAKTPGHRSATPAPSGMTSCAAGSPTPRSRRRNTPRSPRARGQAHHRPADRPPRQRPQPEGGRRAGRAVHRLALPRRLHRLAVRDAPGRGAPPRPRPGRAGLRRLEPTARLPTCHRARSRPTPPGWRSPRSAATCCAPPDAWPASPTPEPAAPPCAATSSTSPPGPPGTAAATSPPPARRLAPRAANGPACSTPPPARPPLRPDQPRPVTAPPAAQAARQTARPYPRQEPRTSRTDSERQENRRPAPAQDQLSGAAGRKAITRIHAVDRGLSRGISTKSHPLHAGSDLDPARCRPTSRSPQLLDRLRCSDRILMFPYVHHCPAQLLKLPVLLHVSGNVSLKLLAPPFAVVLRQDAVIRTRVPEAAVHKNRYAS